MGKIRFVSHVIQYIFWIMLIATPIAYFLFWTNFWADFGIGNFFEQLGWNMSNVPQPAWIELINGNVPPYTRFVCLIISLIPIATFMFLYYYLMRLFTLYGRGEIFTQKTVGYIRNCGITLLLWQILHPLYQILLTFTLSINNEPGQRFIAVTFSTAQARDLVTALVIIVVSWIMQRGCDLEDEVRLTV